MWSFSDDLVISNLDSIYPYSNADCVLVFDLESEKSENKIEVIEPEPEQHVQEVMTLFKWEW